MTLTPFVCPEGEGGECVVAIPLIHITGCVGNLMLVLDIFLGETNSERIFKIRTKTKLEMEQTNIS